MKTSDLAEKCTVLRKILAAHSPLMVAYSGGVDSTCLLAMAHSVLGDRVVGVIADSPSLPRASLSDALAVATSLGVRIEVIQTTELDDPEYASNPPNRCYFCKAELFKSMDLMASAGGFEAIAYGENADDPAHLRPGSQAAAEFSVIAPLKQAGLTKADVRALSRDLGLPTADAPAQPCLSSRIPHGTPVTRAALDYVERGEVAMRQLGFQIFRVRFVDGEPPGARVLAGTNELVEAVARTREIETALQSEGFGEVIVDPLGYRSPSA